MAYRRTHRVNTGIVRIFNTFGPRMRAHDGRAVPTFIRQALAGEPLTVAGDGTQTRSLCYVDDLIDGLCRFAATDHPGPVNLGNPEEISMLELARWIVDLAGSESVVSHIERPVDDPSVRRPDITLASSLLGWEPAVPVEVGLRRTIEWFRSAMPLADPGRAPLAGRAY
jgi:dTDP-glucose 4,6-dehydratase